MVIDKNPDNYASVQHWMEVVNARYSLSRREWEQRLDVLWDFCDSLDKDPDAIIKDALDERSSKLDYMRHLRRWAKEQARSESAAHELQNVVRSFFINNGARVLTKPYPDVYGSRGS